MTAAPGLQSRTTAPLLPLLAAGGTVSNQGGQEPQGVEARTIHVGANGANALGVSNEPLI